MGRKYKVRHDFLDELNTQEKAYFLGLMSSDGCNMNGRNECKLTLDHKDYDIMEKMNYLIYDEMVLKYRERTSRMNIGSGNIVTSRYYDLRFSSEQLSKRLFELGCVHNKTYKMKFPEDNIIPERLFNHYIRGFWDGDGHIGTYANGEVKLTATEHFCLGLKKKLDSLLNINCQVTKDSRHTSTFRYLRIAGRVQTNKFLSWLYKDATIYMERKYQKYLELVRISEYCDMPMIVQYDIKGNFIKGFPSKLNAHEETGVHRRKITECCFGKRESADGYIFRQLRSAKSSGQSGEGYYIKSISADNYKELSC